MSVLLEGEDPPSGGSATQHRVLQWHLLRPQMGISTLPCEFVTVCNLIKHPSPGEIALSNYLSDQYIVLYKGTHKKWVFFLL